MYNGQLTPYNRNVFSSSFNSLQLRCCFKCDGKLFFTRRPQHQYFCHHQSVLFHLNWRPSYEYNILQNPAFARLWTETVPCTWLSCQRFWSLSYSTHTLHWLISDRQDVVGANVWMRCAASGGRWTATRYRRAAPRVGATRGWMQWRWCWIKHNVLDQHSSLVIYHILIVITRPSLQHTQCLLHESEHFNPFHLHIQMTHSHITRTMRQMLYLSQLVQ